MSERYVKPAVVDQGEDSSRYGRGFCKGYESPQAGRPAQGVASGEMDARCLV